MAGLLTKEETCKICNKVFTKRLKRSKSRRRNGGKHYINIVRTSNAVTCSRRCSTDWYHLSSEKRKDL